MDLNEFKQEVHALAVEKGFYDPAPTDAELIAAIHSEISEAFEEWSAGRPTTWYKCMIDGELCNGPESCAYKQYCSHSDDFVARISPEPHGIAVELIDVALRVLDLAADNALRLREDAYGFTPGTLAEMTLPELAIYIHYEASALYTCNWYNKNLSLYGPEREHHLSCILTAILTWLRAQGIDPEALLLEKHEYNKGRPYRHGGKRV